VKILIPTADYPPIIGGISSVALNVSRELARMGHAVTVVAPRIGDTKEFDRAEPSDVIRFPGYRYRASRFLSLFAATWPRVADADLILGINASYGGIIGLLARRRYGTPYAAFGSAYEFLKFRHRPMPAGVLRRVYAQARVVVAISGFTRENLFAFGAPPHKLEVIRPGAPQTRTYSDEEIAEFKRRYTLDGCRVILGVGRFVPRKGHVTLLRSMPRILKAIPDALLVLVGKGSHFYEAVSEARALDIRKRVLFPGILSEDDMAKMYQSCEVFALPTGDDGHAQVEGFGLVFVEANAYGKPVVAGRSGGVADAVLDGETGIIVEPDRPEALADAIVSLMRDPARAQEMGANGRRRVETELNWERFTERLLDAIEAHRP